jgi:hypothetical protein
MDNYPMGAAHDPLAPYNAEPGDEKEVVVAVKMIKTAVVLVDSSHTYLDYGNDLKEYFQNQYRTPKQIIECCQKIVKQLRKQGNRFFAGINLWELDEDCDYWEEEELKLE